MKQGLTMIHTSGNQCGAKLALGAMFIFIGYMLTFIVVSSFADEPRKLELHQKVVTGSEEPELTYINVKGFGVVPYQKIFEARSLDDESADAFALRIASKLRDYTAEYEFEACGVIATDTGGGLGVVIGSNHGHTVCVNFNSKVPAGMTATEQTIHSHTTMTNYRSNASDRLVLGHSTRPGQMVRGDNPERFSEEDFTSPGYMVSGTKLWHQSGRNRVRVVGEMQEK